MTNRAKHFPQYQLESELDGGDATAGDGRDDASTRMATHAVEETREDSVEFFSAIRMHRGLREITPDQTHQLAGLLHTLGLEPSALEGPKREVRAAVTAHVAPEFLQQFKSLASHYGVSPSNLARLVITGWVESQARAGSGADTDE